MPCFHPVKAFSLVSGGISFVERGDIKGDVKVPCNRCIGCRIDRARDWSLRIGHESKLHQHNWFVTITYDDQNMPIPPSLNYSDFQNLCKALRKKHGSFRFFMCGEYGDETRRPHFHAITFGLQILDLKRWGGPDKMPTFRSASLEASWGKGMIVIGAVTPQSANYVARYSLKKITGDLAGAHYRWVDPKTGEEHQLEPEFCHMSTKPGIGAAWYDRFHTDFHVHDFAIQDGHKLPIPRYYDKRASRHGYQVDELKQAREIKSRPKAWNNTPERLQTRETVAKARANLSKRAL
ncbi:MAG: replication initiator protein [Arizlama microvirus]|nr:MAG: replication initiator protein [Arizlama microvirus]